MFTLKEQATCRPRTIYGIHKSGPQHHQTKFLVYDESGWRWAWAVEFVPLGATTTLRRPRQAGAPVRVA